jgi:hypothetical protein
MQPIQLPHRGTRDGPGGCKDDRASEEAAKKERGGVTVPQNAAPARLTTQLVVVDDAIIDHPTVEDRDARRLRWHGPSAGCELVSCCPRATKGGVRQDSSLQNTTCDKRS